MFINDIQKGRRSAGNFKWRIEALADFFEQKEKIGCRWVRSWSNPSNIFDMALIKLIQAIYY